MTVTESPPASARSPFERDDPGAPWTLDDLEDLPEGNRYEIFDGCLLVSPVPSIRHADIADTLADLLKRHAPEHLRASGVGFGLGSLGTSDYLVPDVVVAYQSVVKARVGRLLRPPDVLLVVEVLSPSNAKTDLLLKRHEYAAGGIPLYWIVDPDKETLTVLTLDGTGERYAESAVVRPGEPWKTEEPFPLTLDLSEIF